MGLGMEQKMEAETWKDIPRYRGVYQVSDQGRVKSLRFGRELILKQLVCGPYPRVNLQFDNIREEIRVHRLVAETFLQDWNPALFIDHIDRNKANNNLSNLRMATREENRHNQAIRSKSGFYGVVRHSKRKGFQAYGPRVNGKRKYLGYSNDPITCAQMYDNYVREEFDEFYPLNFL